MSIEVGQNNVRYFAKTIKYFALLFRAHFLDGGFLKGRKINTPKKESAIDGDRQEKHQELFQL